MNNFYWLSGYKKSLLTNLNTMLLYGYPIYQGEIMKLKSMLFVLCFSLLANVFAANVHFNPKMQNEDKKTVEKGISYPGYCQIEIINDSFTDVRVYGTFDDGASLDFSIYRYESPHYISLFYYGYCHSGMYITIQSPFYTIYSGWTNVNSTIRIVPYLKNQANGLNNQAKAEISTR